VLRDYTQTRTTFGFFQRKPNLKYYRDLAG